MGMFGRKKFVDPRMSQPSGIPQGAMVQVPGRSNPRGLMGGGWRQRLPEILQTIGAGLQQMDGGEELTQYLASQRDNALMDEQMGWRREDRDREAQDAANLEVAIGSLPESQRPWARLAPEAVARTVLSPPETPETHYDNNTGNFWQETPTGPQVVGRMPGWQRSGGSGGAAPSGYRFTTDGNLEPIPGGPADARVNETGRRRATALQDSAENLQNVLGAIDQAVQLVGSDTTGLQGQVMRGIGGSRALDLSEALEPVVANLGFEALAEMRRNSETGGALGQVAVREIELLQRTVRSLDTRQSEAQLRSNLTEVRRQVQRTLQAIRAAQQELTVPAEAAPSQPEQGRVMQWTPERGVH